MGKACRTTWTACFFLSWVLVLLVVILTHAGVAKVVPPTANFVDNLYEGFMKTMKFDSISSDGSRIQNASAIALASCGCVSSTLCETCSLVDVDRTSTTNISYAIIIDALNTSLEVVLKVATDKYLGSDGFNETANNIRKITTELKKVNPVNGPCIQSLISYCVMHRAGEALVVGVGNVTSEIDSMLNNEAITEVKSQSSKLKLLHVLPYILVVSMAFFTCFWLQGGECCCCKNGNCAGCLFFLIPHILFWFLYFVISVIVVSVGAATKYWAVEQEIELSPGKKPTIGDLIDHIEIEYTEFYDLALKDLIAGMLTFWQAFVAALVLCIWMVVYGCCMCCFRPYRKPPLPDGEEDEFRQATEKE